MNTTLWLFFAANSGFFFVAGLLIGRHYTVKGYLMPRRLLHPIRSWRALSGIERGMLIVMVLGLVSTAVALKATFAAIDARNQAQALTACSKRATADALTWFENLQDQTTHPPKTPKERKKAQHRFDRSLVRYIASLHLLQQARESDDPAAICAQEPPVVVLPERSAPTATPGRSPKAPGASSPPSAATSPRVTASVAPQPTTTPAPSSSSFPTPPPSPTPTGNPIVDAVDDVVELVRDLLGDVTP